MLSRILAAALLAFAGAPLHATAEEPPVAAGEAGAAATDQPAGAAATDQPAGAPSAAAAPARPDPRLRVVVPALEAQGVAAALATNLSGVILLRLEEIPNADVVGQADIEKLLNQEQRRQLAGCRDDTDCVSGIAGALDAARLVWGSVGRVGDTFLVNLTLLDTESDSVIRRTSRKALSADNLVEAASDAADALWLTPEMPADGCVDCEAKPTSLQIAIKLGNNFMSLFTQAVEVSSFAPGLDLDFAYRFADRVAAFLTVGLSLGTSDTSTSDDFRFLVIPLNLGIRYHTQRFANDLSAFGGLSLGVGFVHTALFDGDEELGPAFSATAHGGLAYALVGNVGAILEVSYQLTSSTPDELRDRPLAAAAIRLGVAYGF